MTSSAIRNTIVRSLAIRNTVVKSSGYKGYSHREYGNEDLDHKENDYKEFGHKEYINKDLYTLASEIKMKKKNQKRRSLVDSKANGNNTVDGQCHFIGL